ncbi:MAG: hypothetical protein Q8Q89_04230 [bacterium]|nr:hypothetical protein [bacterium]
MNRKVFTVVIYLVLLFLVFNLFLNRFTNTVAAQTATPVFEAPVCKDNKGVNCSIIRPDASVVCNDGTVDDSYIIYGVPECQKTIEAMDEQQSSFMEQSGCFPPSEMICINEQSYQSLYTVLNASGLANSELGKNELAQCRQQIGEYTLKKKDYNQCLSENNNPEFTLPSAIFIKPLLKAIFCPIFYGDNVSYDYEADLCLCDQGYFMSNEKCEGASLICQSKYGPTAISQNGNCYCKEGYRLNTNKNRCVLVEQLIKPSSAPVPIPTKKPNPPPTISPPLQIVKQISTPKATPQPTKDFSSSNQSQTAENLIQTKPSFITKIFTTFISGIKNILKLW